jgi:nucleotide-binding universal stress UspA family protein
MIKTILVPVSGSDADQSVFATALAVGRPFAAHLSFLHIHLAPVTAATRVPHFEFCEGAAISATLQTLRREGDRLARAAQQHFAMFCSAHEVEVRDRPGSTPDVVTASFAEESDEPAARLLSHARHSDLLVVGRPRSSDHMPGGLIETLLTGSGRPIVIAPQSVPPSVIGTVAVAWKEAPEAARALTAAMPLLKLAQRVVLLSVAEREGRSESGLHELAQQLAWHGIGADVSIVTNASEPAAVLLPRIAARLGADLLVAGGFGRAPAREYLFGGVTQSLIEHADCAVFLLH